MARPLKSALRGNIVKTLVEKIDGVVKRNINGLGEGAQAGVMSVSLESYSELGVNASDVETTLENLTQDLTEVQADAAGAVSELEGGVADSAIVEGGEFIEEHGNKVAVEAAAVLAMSYKNPAAYYRDGYSNPSFESGVVIHNMVSSGANGSIVTLPEASRPSIESFDEKETEKWREHSYAINMMAAKQHPFAELFYRTQIITPDQAGFVMSIRRNMVWETYQGSGLKGDAVKFPKRNVLQGLLDYTVLESNSTELIPCVHAGENDDQFIDPAIVAPRKVVQANEEFETNYLKFGVDFNLPMLAQTPSRLQKGSPTFTDSLDSRIALKDLLVTVAKGGVKEQVNFEVNRDQYAAYTATREYNFRQMQLKFHSTLAVNAETKTVDQAESANLKALLDAGYSLELSVKVDGEINVETGSGETAIRPLAISKAFDKDGVEIALSDARIAALIAGLTFEAAGYSLEARLTNINQLELGLAIDSDVMKHGFMIPTLPPLVIIKPALQDEEKVYPRIEALTTAYRVQMRNAAVTTLLNRRDTLKAYLGVGVPHPIESNQGLEGVGQYYVRPYYMEAEVDLLKDLNNLTSAAKQTDIQGLLVSKINEMVYTADQLTGYTAALEAAFPGRTPKPHVAIGTDMRLPQYLQIPGDDRTVGIGYDYTIARISDLRMKDQIIMTFVLPNVDEPHPLQHGVLGLIPEYLVNFQMIRNQRIGNEIRLTPRYRYFNFLPIMLSIRVVNLEEAIAKRTSQANDVKVTNAAEFKGEVTPPTGG
ncbi:putative major capsid protein [Serratia phage vB_SmaS-Totoro]|nr:putative major capsid protein [Serratia phage vB_SmaS-Totoro]